MSTFERMDPPEAGAETLPPSFHLREQRLDYRHSVVDDLSTPVCVRSRHRDRLPDPDRHGPELLPRRHGRYRYRSSQLLPADRVTLGSAIVGTLFASRLLVLLDQRLAAVGARSTGVVDPNSLTPASVAQMSDPLKTAVISSYNDALAPIYLALVPMMAVAFVLLLFVREKPLAVTNEEGLRRDAGAATRELVGQGPER